ncbi:MAG TPA: nitrate reductase molybdenum cofactor assembly chaperone [Mycobacteriales bacterium]|nr:nitrate reductase molybdenum cofactor assembly chaperone [Mycobacteriales bacterium]
MTALSEQARAMRVAARLLGYPDDALREDLPMLRAAAEKTGRSAEHLTAFCERLAATPAAEAQAAYVDTFDLRRRCCLYLTYYSYGDTRKRGMALLRFTHAYKTAGYEILDGELPDHLAVVCEFTAAEPAAGGRLLAEHRVGVELLRMALADARSPYLALLDGIRATLPAATARDLDRAVALAASGPPEEEVGLEPFGPPEVVGGGALGGRR